MPFMKSENQLADIFMKGVKSRVYPFVSNLASEISMNQLERGLQHKSIYDYPKLSISLRYLGNIYEYPRLSMIFLNYQYL